MQLAGITCLSDLMACTCTVIWLPCVHQGRAERPNEGASQCEPSWLDACRAFCGSLRISEQEGSIKVLLWVLASVGTVPQGQQEGTALTSFLWAPSRPPAHVNCGAVHHLPGTCPELRMVAYIWGRGCSTDHLWPAEPKILLVWPFPGSLPNPALNFSPTLSQNSK